MIPVFPVLARLQHNGPYVPVGLQRRSKEWSPITVLPPVLLGILCAASRRASGEGVLCSGYSWLLTRTSCGVAAEVLI